MRIDKEYGSGLKNNTSLIMEGLFVFIEELVVGHLWESVSAIVGTPVFREVEKSCEAV